MRTLKLAFCEFKKIFFKPIMIIAFFAVIATMVVSTITFNPVEKEKSSVTLGGSSIINLYQTVFLSETNANSKSKLDKKLESQKDWFIAYTTKIAGEEELKTLKNYITITDSDIQQLNQQLPKFYTTPKDATEDDILKLFDNLYKSSTNTYNYLTSLNTDLSFYISNEDFESLCKYFSGISKNIPNNFPEPEKQFNEVNNFISQNYPISKITSIVQNLKTLNLNQETVDNLLEKYYYNIYSGEEDTVLGKLNTEIVKFVNEKQESEKTEDIEQFSILISNYKSIVNMSSSALKYGLTIETVGDKSDKEIIDYIGFSNYNSYLYKQTFATNKFLLENNKFDYDYLTPFSFNSNSGEQTNAFDFVVYSMQILTLVIVIFLIFVSSGTIATELSNGTMKMLAIRPYNRFKIIIAKFLSCFALMFVLLLMGFAISSVIGLFVYGIGPVNVLTVFNSTSVIVLNAFVVMLLYFISCMINCTFFIALTLLISVLFKSNVVSVIIGLLVYVFTIISNALLYSYVWFTYLPFAHFDLFKYFGTPINTGQFFGFSIGIGSNFLISALYLGVTIFLSLIISIIVFRKRNIA